VSFGRQYFGPYISQHPWRKGTEQPTFFWMPSIGVTGMTFYTGDRFPSWKRNVFVGGLREGEIPRTGQLQRIVFNEKWQEIRRESLLRELHQRIRDVRQGPDGLLYVLNRRKRWSVASNRAGRPLTHRYHQRWPRAMNVASVEGHDERRT
jgi:glucose/arabinose dehydrogenase